MKKLAKKIASVATAVSTSFLTSPVFAQETGVIDITRPAGGLAQFTVGGLVGFIIRILIIAAFIIAFIFLIIGGIRWITAGGDPKGVESARNTVTAALIGLVIVLAAFAIIRLIEFFFNVTIISGPLTLPTVKTFQ